MLGSKLRRITPRLLATKKQTYEAVERVHGAVLTVRGQQHEALVTALLKTAAADDATK